MKPADTSPSHGSHGPGSAHESRAAPQAARPTPKPWGRVTRIHRWIYRKSGGRVGASLAGRAILLLTTVGRRTGREHTIPLTYYGERDRYVVVASNGGDEREPVWWLNLERTPRASIQVGPRTLEVEARRAVGEERARLWSELTRYNPPYAKYQQRCSREIPVVVLSPIAPAKPGSSL